MLLVLIVGGSIGWEVNQVGRMRRAITTLHRPVAPGPGEPAEEGIRFILSEQPAGSRVEIAFDDEYSDGRFRTERRMAWVPGWLRRLLGEDHFRNVSLVNFHRRPTAEDWDALDALPMVQDLSFAYVPLAEGDLDRVATSSKPALRNLSLLDTKIHDQALTHVAVLKNLRELDLRMTAVTDAGLVALARLDQLEELWLSLDSGTDAGLAHLQGLRKLRVLDAGGNSEGVSDVGLGYLREMRHLESFEFQAHGVTDAGMAILETLPRLRSLNIQPVFADREPMLKVSATGVQRLDRFAHLDSLELNGLFLLDDNWLEPIGRLKNLTVLKLSGNGITNAGMVHLAKLTFLSELRISSDHVHDAGLSQLEPLTKLKRLSFLAEISDAAIAAFRTSHSGLRIDNARWSDISGSGPEPIAPIPDESGLLPVAPLPPPVAPLPPPRFIRPF